MSHDQRMEFWEHAKRGGMRNKHNLHEKRVMADIQENMNQKPKSKNKRKSALKEKIV